MTEKSTAVQMMTMLVEMIIMMMMMTMMEMNKKKVVLNFIYGYQNLSGEKYKPNGKKELAQ